MRTSLPAPGYPIVTSIFCAEKFHLMAWRLILAMGMLTTKNQHKPATRRWKGVTRREETPYQMACAMRKGMDAGVPSPSMPPLPSPSSPWLILFLSNSVSSSALCSLSIPGFLHTYFPNGHR
jgi:hypothetical protein